jgi:hypothetical protein
MTRSAALSHRSKELAAQNADYETVFTTIMTASESEAVDHLRCLRSHAAVNGYAEMLRNGIPTLTRRCWKDVRGSMCDDTPSRLPNAAASVHAPDLLIGGMLAQVDSLVEADHRLTTQWPSIVTGLTPGSQSLLEPPNIYHPPLSM